MEIAPFQEKSVGRKKNRAAGKKNRAAGKKNRAGPIFLTPLKTNGKRPVSRKIGRSQEKSGGRQEKSGGWQEKTGRRQEKSGGADLPDPP